MRDEVEGARAVTKLARESTRAASKRAEEAIRETKEKDARIAALERRLKLNSGNNHQPPLLKIGRQHLRYRELRAYRHRATGRLGGSWDTTGHI